MGIRSHDTSSFKGKRVIKVSDRRLKRISKRRLVKYLLAHAQCGACDGKGKVYRRHHHCGRYTCDDYTGYHTCPQCGGTGVTKEVRELLGDETPMEKALKRIDKTQGKGSTTHAS